MGKECSSSGSLLQSCKPYAAMVCLQFGYAGMNIITKVSLNRGMSHYVLVVYRHAIATAVIAPFAFLFERGTQPKITLATFTQLFVLGLLGPVIDQNFYYAGLKSTSPTFSCAMSNILPAMTFVMAVIFGMERLNMKKLRCQAKVAGTAVTVAGAMVMTLYKGPGLEMLWTKHPHDAHRETDAPRTAQYDRDWLKGSVLLIVATLAWASFFVLQAKALKTYRRHQLSLTSLVCFIGTLQSIGVTFVMERRASVWIIGWDMNLLAAAYAGIVTSGISYYVQGLVMKTKGPVFATAFSPLMMIIVAVMGSFILAEKIYLGGLLGAVLIVGGLYSVLWGKSGEKARIEEDDSIPEPIKEFPAANGGVPPAVGNIELKKTEETHEPCVVITLPPVPKA